MPFTHDIIDLVTHFRRLHRGRVTPCVQGLAMSPSVHHHPSSAPRSVPRTGAARQARFRLSLLQPHDQPRGMFQHSKAA